jgi:hypothetical protein
MIRRTGYPLNSSRLLKNCGQAKAYAIGTLPPLSHFSTATGKRVTSKRYKFSRFEFLALCAAWGWLCFYCGTGVDAFSAEPDHMTPTSRGGSARIENIAPACKTCNRLKGSMTAEEFLASRISRKEGSTHE